MSHGKKRIYVCVECLTQYDEPLGACPEDGGALRQLTVEQRDEFIGQLIDERWVIERKIGEGGMGSVYLATQLNIDRKVAIKLMRRGMERGQEYIERFLREASVASKVSHPHLVSIYDFGQTEDGLLFIAMEYLEGLALSEILDHQELGLTFGQVLMVGKQLCAALAAAHEVGIIHRDLKPENIFLLEMPGGDIFIKVLDFGIAKHLGAGQTMTQTGQVFGTPEYMSPEQCRGKSQIDARSDLYSLGCILYEMLTGYTPFRSETLLQILFSHVSDPVPPMELVAEEPTLRVMEPLVYRLLAKRAAGRLDSALQVREQLEEARAQIERLDVRMPGWRSLDPEHSSLGSDAETLEMSARPPTAFRGGGPPDEQVEASLREASSRLEDEGELSFGEFVRETLDPEGSSSASALRERAREAGVEEELLEQIFGARVPSRALEHTPYLPEAMTQTRGGGDIPAPAASPEAPERAVDERQGRGQEQLERAPLEEAEGEDLDAWEERPSVAEGGADEELEGDDLEEDRAVTHSEDALAVASVPERAGPGAPVLLMGAVTLLSLGALLAVLLQGPEPAPRQGAAIGTGPASASAAGVGSPRLTPEPESARRAAPSHAEGAALEGEPRQGQGGAPAGVDAPEASAPEERVPEAKEPGEGAGGRVEVTPQRRAAAPGAVEERAPEARGRGAEEVEVSEEAEPLRKDPAPQPSTPENDQDGGEAGQGNDLRTPTSIQRRARQISKEARRCVDMTFRRTPDLFDEHRGQTLRVRVKFFIQPDGTVSKAVIEDRAQLLVQQEQLIECIESTYERATFTPDALGVRRDVATSVLAYKIQ